MKCQLFLGGMLQDIRRNNHLSAKRETALGYSLGSSRFASALRLRPVEVAPGQFAPYVVYSDSASRERSVRELVEAVMEG